MFPLALLTANPIVKRTYLTLSFRLVPAAVCLSFYSTICRRKFVFSAPAIDPPVPKKLPFELTAHGRRWNDPYHWMSNIDDPDFVSYLKQENLYAEAFMDNTHDKQKELFLEMTSRMPAKISTPPERWGPWLYYQYVPEGKDYPVLCRKLWTDEEGWVTSIINYVKGGTRREEILLDWNEIAERHGYVHVGTCRVSPDHNFLAYTIDTTGSENFMLQVKDLREGHVNPKLSADGVVSLAWAHDSSNLFYTVSDKSQRPYKVLCTKIGSKHDSIIFTEDDPNFCVDITCTKDGKFITVNSNSRNSSEVYVVDAASPLDGLKIIHKRVPGVQYFLEHHYGFFYVLTNYPMSGDKKLLDRNYYLARCGVEDICSANWQNIFLPSEGTSLQDMDIFNEYLVLFLHKKGCSRMCSIDLPVDINCKQVIQIEDLNPWFFPVLSDLCQMFPCSNHNFVASSYRAVLSSPVLPDVIVDYDMSRKRFSIIYQDEVLGVSSEAQTESPSVSINGEILAHVKDDPNKHNLKIEGVKNLREFSVAYSCEMHEVVSHDGVRVPLTVIYSRAALQKAQSPGILQAYGAYGEVLDKSWCADRLSLLDRGWVLAFADVRGGGGGDSSWHEQGSGVRKINSVHDFVTCSKYLIDKGYVQKEKLAAIGYSAGSLVVGAAINMYQDLFCAAILKVPFLDVCNTLMDSSLPLTILDYEEFGNPEIKHHFESIMKYAPYDNIAGGLCYPAMLVTASFNDSRVGVWEAAKWVAKVREITCTNCSRSVILKTEMNGGHFAEGGRFGQCISSRTFKYKNSIEDFKAGSNLSYRRRDGTCACLLAVPLPHQRFRLRHEGNGSPTSIVPEKAYAQSAKRERQAARTGIKE
ncbi:hypothetical protein Nepgr_003656 [Nepenthes gracilis]|uniref:Prolyl endopeptidase n=1 Tax=Nepenthes gracilis TaxID=150966 RepID=A0AAD3S008_NEPGR|nr:hypothetical protein Nepgr_003656 [Nepenthes gracilis]